MTVSSGMCPERVALPTSSSTGILARVVLV
jgi:hypothetical protein